MSKKSKHKLRILNRLSVIDSSLLKELMPFVRHLKYRRGLLSEIVKTEADHVLDDETHKLKSLCLNEVGDITAKILDKVEKWGQAHEDRHQELMDQKYVREPDDDCYDYDDCDVPTLQQRGEMKKSSDT